MRRMKMMINGEAKDVKTIEVNGEIYVRCRDLPFVYDNKVKMPLLERRFSDQSVSASADWSGIDRRIQ